MTGSCLRRIRWWYPSGMPRIPGFLGTDIATRNGFVQVNSFNQTSNETVFAIGDIVGPGLITNAIGAGKRVAEAIDDIVAGKAPLPMDSRAEIDKDRVSLEYFNPRTKSYDAP